MAKGLKEIVQNFKDQKILVVGDVMLDKSIYGIASRLSPEWPGPVVKVAKKEYFPGGAGNTAANLASLGANIDLLGVIGQDNNGKKLYDKLKEIGVNPEMCPCENRLTTTKTRVIANKYQIARYDEESTDKIDEASQKLIVSIAAKKIDGVGAVVISDYNKGVITERVARELIQMCNEAKKPIIIDPKPDNKEFYKGAYLITPNTVETCEMTNIDPEKASIEEIVQSGGELVQYLGSNVLLTLGEHGMALYEKGKDVQIYPAKTKREVYDVSGAGDTVVATTALALASGATLGQAVQIANYAAGIVVGKRGTATVTKDELLENILDLE